MSFLFSFGVTEEGNVEQRLSCTGQITSLSIVANSDICLGYIIQSFNTLFILEVTLHLHIIVDTFSLSLFFFFFFSQTDECPTRLNQPCHTQPSGTDWPSVFSQNLLFSNTTSYLSSSFFTGEKWACYWILTSRQPRRFLSGSRRRNRKGYILHSVRSEWHSSKSTLFFFSLSLSPSTPTYGLNRTFIWHFYMHALQQPIKNKA